MFGRGVEGEGEGNEYWKSFLLQRRSVPGGSGDAGWEGAGGGRNRARMFSYRFGTVLVLFRN